MALDPQLLQLATTLTVVFSPHDIDSEGHTGVGGNAPEERKRLVSAALRVAAVAVKNSSGSSGSIGTVSDVAFVSVKSPEKNLKLAELVHDPGMLRLFESAWMTWEEALGGLPSFAPSQMDEHIEPDENPTKKSKIAADTSFCSSSSSSRAESWTPKQISDLLKLRGRGPYLVQYCKEESTQGFGLVPAIFAPRHDGLQRPGSSLYGQLGFYAMDKETPITPSTLQTLVHDLAVTRAAVNQLQALQQQHAKDDSKIQHVVYAQVTHPGHHAGPSSYGGFCFVNSAALAVRLLQNTFSKVAVVDVDYHSGNGTMAMFWDDPSVFFASLHGDLNAPEYPFHAGFEDQKGGPNAPGSTMNVLLPQGTSFEHSKVGHSSSYRVQLQRVLDSVVAFGAEVIVVSLGLDTLLDDPVAQPEACFRLLPNDFAPMGAMFRSLLLPTLVVQEGGYMLERVPLAVVAFLTGQVTA